MSSIEPHPFEGLSHRADILIWKVGEMYRWRMGVWAVDDTELLRRSRNFAVVLVNGSFEGVLYLSLRTAGILRQREGTKRSRCRQGRWNGERLLCVLIETRKPKVKWKTFAISMVGVVPR